MTRQDKTGTRRLPRVVAGIVLLLALAFPLQAEIEVPFLAGRVTDQANMMSPGAVTEIEAELASIEESTSAQVAVLTLPTLDGEPIESFALRVVEAWKLGKKGQDNGALLLIVRDDRKMRIETGYGLEGVLPDVICKRILEERLTPRFRQGDFDGGIAEAVSTIGGLVRNDPDALPAEKKQQGISNFILYFIIALVLFNSILVPILRLFFPGASWLASTGSSRGWSSRGGGGWSGGGGGGGFSGGGGSFGGGGASGSW